VLYVSLMLSVLVLCNFLLFIFFFFNDTSTTDIYTLSLHDALPICAADSTVVVKADGLAAGKGVIVAPSRPAAEQAVRELMNGGEIGRAHVRTPVTLESRMPSSA